MYSKLSIYKIKQFSSIDRYSENDVRTTEKPFLNIFTLNFCETMILL